MRSTTYGSIGSTWRLLRRVLPISFAVALTLTFGTADAWAKGNTAPPAMARPAPSLAETRALLEEALPIPLLGGVIDDDLIDYAQREAQTLGLEDFQGGDVIIIGASGLAVVLLVVLIVLLV